jgi:hypothetical protein
LRRALLVSVGVPLALLASPASAGADFGEPVTVTATTPGTVTAGASFPLIVEVEAAAGALDIAAQPLHLRVRLAPECGGSFAGTEGPTAIDRALPSPATGSAYATKVTGSATLGETGTETVCAFLEDAQERQFATDTEETLTVVPAACGASTQRLASLNRRLRRVERQLARAHRQRHRASGHRRRALRRRIGKLRKRRHFLQIRKRRAARDAALACPRGAGS